MAFMIGQSLTFIDSFQLMSLSVDGLDKILPNDAFKYTSQAFKHKKFELMTQKGVYP